MQHQSRNDSGADINQQDQVTYDVSQVLMGHDRARVASDKLVLK